MKKFLIALAVLIALFVAALFLVPWNRVLEGRLIAALEDQGFENVSLTVDRVSFTDAQLSNLSIGGDTPLSLQSLTLNYTLSELLEGRLETLSLSGLNVHIVGGETGWAVSGLPAAGASGQAISLNTLLDRLPVARLDVTDSLITIDSPAVAGAIPFALSVHKGGDTRIDAATQPTTLRLGKSDAPVGTLTASLRPAEDGDWTGTWALASIDLSDLTPMPVLRGNGTLEIDDDILTMAGNLDSADKSYRGAFNLLIDPQDSAQNKATLTAASFPFKEGRIATRNVVIPLSGNAPIRATMDVQQVSVDAMLQTLTGKRVTASGTLSGSIPFVVTRDGTYTLGKGTLKADGAGTIQMSGDAIPGDNPQVGLVRDILGNLQYSLLSASVEEAKGRQNTVKLSVEGRNPDVMEGRPVKLNINLSGDVLDFIQHNIMLFTNPQKLLEQSAR